MAMMTPVNFVAHVDHEVARKFANDILNLLDPVKPQGKTKGKAKAKEEKGDVEEK